MEYDSNTKKDLYNFIEMLNEHSEGHYSLSDDYDKKIDIKNIIKNCKSHKDLYKLFAKVANFDLVDNDTLLWRIVKILLDKEISYKDDC